MSTIGLTKKIRKAIEEFGSSARDRLYWEWLTSESRTVMSGYALFIVSGFHENGSGINRRLWLNSDGRYALQIAEAIDKQIGFPEQLQQLRKLIEQIELHHAAQESERRLDFRQYRERWPR